jgi:DNA mismatch endonuclease (patch repair protein)
MTDFLTKAQRSRLMSRIRGYGNQATELELARLFRKYRIKGWRRHSLLTGKPDFVFKSHRVAIFVDGCFWHGCPHHGAIPVQNRFFWRAKLAKNRVRDRIVRRILKNAGWVVVRIWQHDLCQRNQLRCIRRIQRALLAVPQRVQARLLSKNCHRGYWRSARAH